MGAGTALEPCCCASIAALSHGESVEGSGACAADGGMHASPGVLPYHSTRSGLWLGAPAALPLLLPRRRCRMLLGLVPPAVRTLRSRGSAGSPRKCICWPCDACCGGVLTTGECERDAAAAPADPNSLRKRELGATDVDG